MKNLRLFWFTVLLTALNLLLMAYGHHLRAQAIAENAAALELYKHTQETANQAMKALEIADLKLKSKFAELDAANAKLKDCILVRSIAASLSQGSSTKESRYSTR